VSSRAGGALRAPLSARGPEARSHGTRDLRSLATRKTWTKKSRSFADGSLAVNRTHSVRADITDTVPQPHSTASAEALRRAHFVRYSLPAVAHASALHPPRPAPYRNHHTAAAPQPRATTPDRAATAPPWP